MQSEIRLHQANKALGLAIYERLLLLDATLRSIPPAALVQLGAGSPLTRTPAPAPTDARELEASRMLTAGLDLVASRRFVALEFVSATGVRTPVFGRLERNPIDERPVDSDLEAGLPAVIVHPRPGAPAPVYC